MSPPPYAIGSDAWPGLAKLLEECGELQQVAGKLLAYPSGEHPDGAGPLDERLADELADLKAAALFFTRANRERINLHRHGRRIRDKLARFEAWHDVNGLRATAKEDT